MDENEYFLKTSHILYNYYDTKDRLTDIFDMVSKRIYLFYKSPLTRTINFTDEINDTDCALVYKGRITRVEHNQQIISILAEDSTQAKINDKKVPREKIRLKAIELSNS